MAQETLVRREPLAPGAYPPAVRCHQLSSPSRATVRKGFGRDADRGTGRAGADAGRAASIPEHMSHLIAFLGFSLAWVAFFLRIFRARPARGPCRRAAISSRLGFFGGTLSIRITP